MKRLFIYSGILLFCSQVCFGQHAMTAKCDSIVLRNGKKYTGKVIQIEDDFVHFKDQKDTNIYHRVRVIGLKYVQIAGGKRYLFPPPERQYHLISVWHIPAPSPLDKDTIGLRNGKRLGCIITKVDREDVYYSMTNEKKFGYYVADRKVVSLKFSNGRVVHPSDTLIVK